MFEEVQAVISDVLGLPASEIHAESSLVEDLGFDSLDAMEMTVTLEKKYRVKLADQDVMRLKTVQDIVDLLESVAG